MTLLQSIPKVDRILDWPEIRDVLTGQPRPLVLQAIRTTLDELRSDFRQAGRQLTLQRETLCSMILGELQRLNTPSLRRVVNGTGVVIHTNLGRSLLPEVVREELSAVAFRYSNLEFDLVKGERGSRYSHVEGLLCELTGAEAALVVNNNAAAVLLALSSLAAGCEAIVSRGELVEIGGSFRIPDVMGQSGVALREVGTTNRTHLRDYVGAITPETGLLLKIHCSNFAVVGFTATVNEPELVEVGRERGIPVMADVGSGNLFDLSRLGIGTEPTVQEFVRAGVDVVTFSGDKLLGGPQAGLIVGRAQYVNPMKKHPLLRALRIDKLTLAALEGTLRLYRDERQTLREVPTLRMLTATPEELAGKGRRLLRRLRRALPPALQLSLHCGTSQVGGGALPLAELPTTLVSVRVAGLAAQEIEERLRRAAMPVIGRIFRGDFLLDVRTIQDDDLPFLINGLASLS